MDLYTQMDTSSMGDDSYLDYNADKYKDARNFLMKCNLTQYLPVLVAEGFETINAINEITEEDLAAMGVKRGHRRVIQREIATRKGIPKNQPLSSLVLNQPGINLNNDWKNPTNGNASSGSSSGAYTSGYGSMSSSIQPGTPNNYNTVMKPQSNISLNIPNMNDNLDSKESRSSSFSSNEEEDVNDDDDGDGSSTTPLKRKYRRHPKRDKHAPIKPPSAYIMFSNDARAQLKDQNLSFVEIAKYVGDSWKKLDPVQKQTYERTAMREKDKYIGRLNQYRKTPEYKRYQDYLNDFKSKQDALNRKIARSRKKAKISSNGNTNAENDNENGACNTRSGSNSADSFNDPDNGSLTTTGEGAASSSSSGSSDIYKVHRERLKNNKSSLINENTSLDSSDAANNSCSNYQSSSNGSSSTNQQQSQNDGECYSPQQKPPPPMSETMAKANYHRLPFSDNSVPSVPMLPPVKEIKTPNIKDAGDNTETVESRRLPSPKNRRSARFL